MMLTRKTLLLICVLMLPAIVGCAAQKAAGVDLSQQAKLALKPHPAFEAPSPDASTVSQPVLVASSEPVGISPEEESLLLDDWTDDENLSADNENLYKVADPLEKLNRVTFFINDKLYFWLLKPVATGYRAVFPQPARTGVSNFFHNLAAPLRIVNNILQGKGDAAEAELAKFLYNSTVGVLGLGNPAKKHAALNPPVEDMGQTIATYGVGDGFYIVWPILGPSTLRDSAGMLGDRFLNPTSYVQPTEASISLTAHRNINNLSFRLGDYETLKKAALDPYEAFRNAYIQLRQSKIKQ